MPPVPQAGSRMLMTHITALNPHATVALFGQEVNAESYAICRSDMLIKGKHSGLSGDLIIR
jgi:type I restriction-modification system DNA methylase subunit